MIRALIMGIGGMRLAVTVPLMTVIRSYNEQDHSGEGWKETLTLSHSPLSGDLSLPLKFRCVCFKLGLKD